MLLLYVYVTVGLEARGPGAAAVVVVSPSDLLAPSLCESFHRPYCTGPTCLLVYDPNFKVGQRNKPNKEGTGGVH